MSCIFEIPCEVWLVSFPLLVQIESPMAAHYSSTQGVDGNDSFRVQRFGGRGNHSYITRDHILQSYLTQTTRGDSPIFNRLAAPVFLVGKVNALPHPFLYDATIVDLSRSLELLNLEDRGPFDSDESANRHTSRERDYHRSNDVNNHTDRPSSDGLPLSANTRSRHRRQGSDGGGSPPRQGRTDGRSFDPYGPPKSTLEINNTIKDLLLRRHADADQGYVYGFQHPDDVAVEPLSTGGSNNGRPHLIKVGRSKNHQARMRQISKRCKYVPHTVFAHLTPKHAMVERVVHTQLHNLRLRDVGCVGCGTRHEEWVEVDVGRAEHLVALWKAFAECRPYDEQGEMLPAWRERLERLDLGDADCWEYLVHGAPLDRSVAGSPQELEAETTPAGSVEGLIGPSSDGNSGTGQSV